MYKIFLVIAMLVSPACFSQDSSGQVKWEDTSATKKALESTQRFIDSMKNASMNNESMQGLDNLLRYQKEQRDKQRKQALIYIGLGIFFLIILVFGMLRRRAKSNPGQ